MCVQLINCARGNTVCEEVWRAAGSVMVGSLVGCIAVGVTKLALRSLLGSTAVSASMKILSIAGTFLSFSAGVGAFVATNVVIYSVCSALARRF